MARELADGLRLPADISGEALVQAITRTPATEYLLVEPDGSIYGVLTTADVDRAFRETRRADARAGARCRRSSPSHQQLGSARCPDTDDRPDRGPASGADRSEEGEWVRLVDQKGRRHNFALEAGKRFFSNQGHLEHDELIGREEGFTVTSSAGGDYLVFRPLLTSSWCRCRAARRSSTPRTPPRSSRWPTSSRGRTSSRPASARGP